MGFWVFIYVVLFLAVAMVAVILAMIALVGGMVVRGAMANRRAGTATGTALLEAEPRRQLR